MLDGQLYLGQLAVLTRNVAIANNCQLTITPKQILTYEDLGSTGTAHARIKYTYICRAKEVNAFPWTQSQS